MSVAKSPPLQFKEETIFLRKDGHLYIERNSIAWSVLAEKDRIQDGKAYRKVTERGNLEDKSQNMRKISIAAPITIDRLFKTV
jgi:hypothetical protein